MSQPEQPDDLSRRSVLKTGAAALFSVRAASDPVKFGLVGLGLRGSYLLSRLSHLDTAKCVALCDIDQQALDTAAGSVLASPKKYKDYRDLLADKDVEAVIIAVPLYVHFPITRDALVAGKHLFCESDLVFKAEEVHLLRKLAAEHATQVLQVGFERRYSTYFQSVKKMIDQGLLGTVTHIYAQWHRNPGWTMQQGDRDNPKNWRLFREFSGGLAAELACHHIDVANWFFDAAPEFVIGAGGLDFRRDGRDIFDNIQLIYSYPNGHKLVYSAISTSRHSPILSARRPEEGLVVMGTAGAVEMTFGVDGAPPTALWFRESEPSVGVPIILPSTDTDSQNDSFLMRESKIARRWLFDKGVLFPQEDRNPVDAQLESFLSDARRGGGRPNAGLEAGLAASTAVILSNVAMDENRRVAFKQIETMGLPAPPPPPPPPASAATAPQTVPPPSGATPKPALPLKKPLTPPPPAAKPPDAN